MDFQAKEKSLTTARQKLSSVKSTLTSEVETLEVGPLKKLIKYKRGTFKNTSGKYCRHQRRAAEPQ